ncbi:MAG: DUF2851 family protein [Thermomicrobiales bacterium]|nr:MAG: DUF2851 family protein [Thermomicrobiales bacterium]
MEPARIREIAVSRWWNGADLSAPLEIADGTALSIVYRGSWSHGLGPDFQKALIDFGDGRLQAGSIEIHLTSAAWRQHGHDRDPRYNDVILHVVLEHDGSETRRADGRIVPIATVTPDPALLAAMHGHAVDWDLVGGEVCAESVTHDEPAAVRAALWQLGDERLSDRVTRLSARFERETPADVLFEQVMDGLGYSANRAPMRRLAERMPVALIDALLAVVAPEERYSLGLGLLLGAGGFLPLSPAEADIAHLSPDELTGVAGYWRSHGAAWHQDRLAPTSWERVRVRPANHPLVRLGMAAALLTSSFEGLTAAIVHTVRTESDPVQLLIDRSRCGGRAGMGEGRAVAIVASGVLPFLLALADANNDPELSEAASRQWEVLDAGEPNQITRRALRQVAGSTRIGRVGERGMQGLIQLDRVYCAPRRCMECPIAHLALSRQPMLEQAALE